MSKKMGEMHPPKGKSRGDHLWKRGNPPAGRSDGTRMHRRIKQTVKEGETPWKSKKRGKKPAAKTLEGGGGVPVKRGPGRGSAGLKGQKVGKIL